MKDIDGLDLFCGCGGMSLGFGRAGFRVDLGFDAWAAAVETYNANMPHEARLFDLSDVDGFLRLFGTAPAPFLVLGGPPCQDFSSAGLRVESVRASLTYAFARVTTALRPSVFVMENVARARHSKNYAAARLLFKEAGYGLTETVLDAGYCGVPQIRKRFFVVGVAGASDGFLETRLADARASERLTVKDYLGDEIDVERYYRHPRNYARRGVYSVHEPSATIRGVNRPVPAGYKWHPLDGAPPDASLRPLTTWERARVQTFPKDYVWRGPKTQVEQMIGNAVPVNLAYFVASCLKGYVDEECPEMAV